MWLDGQLPWGEAKKRSKRPKCVRKAKIQSCPPRLPSTNDDPIFAKAQHRMGFCLTTAAKNCYLMIEIQLTQINLTGN
jgi:hypothetical protein